MESAPPKAERIIKDLQFLLEIEEQEIQPQIYKYLLEQGTGQKMKDINFPCTIYISYTRYDYQGKFNNQYLNVALKHPDHKIDNVVSPGIYKAVMSMQLNEKAWFNIVGIELHGTSGLDHKGCHIELTICDIKYKNSDDIQSKRLVEQRTRQQAKQFFEQKKYSDALKKYKIIINISEGLDKKKYSEEELKELNKMNMKAKMNYMKCYVKFDYTNEQIDSEAGKSADKYSQQLITYYDDDVSLLIRTKFLLKHKYVTDSFDYAKKLYEKYPNAENKALMMEIKEKISKN